MSLWGWLGRTIGLGSQFNRFWATFSGNKTWANEHVSAERAMTLSAFNRGVTLTSETIGTLPLNLYENRTGSDQADLVRDDGNEYDALLRISPNEDQTTTEFWEGMVGAMMVLGNGYALKRRSGTRTVALDPCDQLVTRPYRDANYALRYRGADRFGRGFDLPASEVFHLKGFGWGDEGLSTISAGAQSLALGLASNKVAGKLMGAGMNASGFVETGTVLNEDDRARLKEILSEYAGSDNAGKMMILEGGMKWNPLQLKPIDAELLSTMGFSIEEIGRWLGIPVILLGHTSEGQTMWGTGVESIIGAWYTLSLRAKLTRIEKVIQKRLIQPKDRGRFFAKFNVDGLLRGDSAAQAALFSAAAQNGWLTRNEIRKLLDYPPLPGGDVLTVQVNMTILKDLASNDNQKVAQARNKLLQLIGLDDETKPLKLAKAA